MNRISIVISMLIITLPIIAQKTPYKIAIEPLWYELDSNCESQKQFGGKWVVVSKITLKHTTKETLTLTHLDITWHGIPLDNLLGSLYKADVNDTFLPIESYLLADSIWHNKQQKMHFTLTKHSILEPITTFYLVLTIPSDAEDPIKSGTFHVEEHSLPRAFQRYAHKNSSVLTFSMNPIRHCNPIKTVAHLGYS